MLGQKKSVIIYTLEQKIEPQSAYLLIILNSISRSSLSRTRSFYISFFKTNVFHNNSKKFDFTKMEENTGPILIIPEEHNIALKFKEDHLPYDHANLGKRYKSDLNLPTSPILTKNHCSKNLLQLMTREDKVI